MTPPRLESCYFGADQPWQWEQMARVLAMTAARHCPDWRIAVRLVQPTPRAGKQIAYARNVEKIEEWSRIVAESQDGDRLLLIDTDTFITNELESVWASEFDLAYTVRAEPYPFNAGVIFLRVSDRTKQFMRDWSAENLRMLADGKYHQPWSAKYGGINQAALGALLRRTGLQGLSVLQLPCAEWNCEDSSWRTFDPTRTRIVHVKSAFRRAIFFADRPMPALVPLVKLWRSLDAASQSATVA